MAFAASSSSLWRRPVIKTLAPSTTKKVSSHQDRQKPFSIRWTNSIAEPLSDLRANVECARSEPRRHRLQPRRSHYRFLRVGETLRPSRFHRRAVEFVVL